MSAENDAWTKAFMVKAIDFLAQHFDIPTPTVVLNCEETCQWADQCHYAACFQPWARKVSFKSGSELGLIAAHEMGHALQLEGLLEEGEGPAIEMERWWSENVNELSCEVCGAPLFISEDSEQGTEVTCRGCGSVYEAVQIH